MFSKRHQDFLQLRERYGHFHYHGFTSEYSDAVLKVRFRMEIEGLATFMPSWEMPFAFNPIQRNNGLIERMLFNLGLVECISYWKLSCSPVFHIHSHRIGPEAITWWKMLFYKGLGEFRYLNDIQADLDSFIEFRIGTEASLFPEPERLELQDGNILVPVGGGKDSAVSLNLLASTGKQIVSFMVNPGDASIRCVKQEPVPGSGLIFKRKLDSTLLKLNDEGFLNGHTPFSALLAFATLPAAWSASASLVALSNESSASEDTIPGTGINHQYSKSWEFEKMFRHYVRAEILQGITYYSFLRPLNELAIAGLFSEMKQYHAVFRSCNVGSKQDMWCGKCPKCLFAYLMLAAWLDEASLSQIFNSKLLNDRDLGLHLDELAGVSAIKPFECVGTIDEVRLSIGLIRRRWAASDCKLLHQGPYDSMFADDGQFHSQLENSIAVQDVHFLPPEQLAILKDKLDEIVVAKLD